MKKSLLLVCLAMLTGILPVSAYETLKINEWGTITQGSITEFTVKDATETFIVEAAGTAKFKTEGNKSDLFFNPDGYLECPMKTGNRLSTGGSGGSMTLTIPATGCLYIYTSSGSAGRYLKVQRKSDEEPVSYEAPSAKINGRDAEGNSKTGYMPTKIYITADDMDGMTATVTLTWSANIYFSGFTMSIGEVYSEGIAIDEANFPDANFRAWLLSQSVGEDSKLTKEEITSIVSMDLKELSIQNLKGIEHFTALKGLRCSNNQLTTIDVTNLKKLERLDCYNNQLTALDISQNTVLNMLLCYNNQLTALDVSKNTALKTIVCYSNKLTTLDAANCTLLENFRCQENQLTSLIVPNSTALTYLSCRDNQLTSLDVTKNTALKVLLCHGNKLTTLNVNTLHALDTLYCYNNQLSALDLSGCPALTRLSCYNNKLTTLDLTNNPLVNYVRCENNLISGTAMDALIASLPSISSPIFRAIYPDSPTEGNVMLKTQVAAAKTRGWTPLYYNGTDWVEYAGSDPTTVVEINETNFPDANFRNYLLSQTYGSDGKLTESEIANVKEIILNSINIASLKGIEFFTQLERLTIRGSQLTTLNLSNFTSLRKIHINSNPVLSSLDISGCTSLSGEQEIKYNKELTTLNASNCPQVTKFELDSNHLTTLNLSGCTALKTLECGSNQLTALDVSECTALQELECESNQLTALDVTKNTALKELRCAANPLNSLDLSKNTVLEILDLAETLYTEFPVTLTSIDLTHNPALKWLSISSPITSLDLSKNTLLEELTIRGSQLTTLNLSNFTSLQTIYMYSNPILSSVDISGCTALTRGEITNNDMLTSLDVSKNTALTRLNCYNNQLTSLDVSKNTALTSLNCSNNLLTSLDVSKNTALTELSCHDNQLTALDVSKNTALTELSCHDNQLTALDVSKNTALTELSCHDNQLTALDVSKNTALTSLNCSNNLLTSLDVSKNTALTSLNCSNNLLTSLDVSKSTALRVLSCEDNKLTSLDLSKNTNLYGLDCYQNQIKGAAMDALVTSLPMRENGYEGGLYIIYFENEGNVMTTEQVAAAKAKNWSVYHCIRDELGYENWEAYAGSDPTAIENIESGTSASKNGRDIYFDLSGRRVMTPTKGVYVKNGKKVVVK